MQISWLRQITKSCIFATLILFSTEIAAHATSAYDRPPQGVPVGPIDLPNTYGFDALLSDLAPVDNTVWTPIFQEAMEEWDDLLCFEDNLRWGDTYDTSVQWQDNQYFVDQWGDEYDGSLAVYSFDDNEIYFNTQHAWDFTLGKPSDGVYSFRAIAKHEIGHSLGIDGDWGQKPASERPAYASEDEIMWGVFSDGRDYNGLKPSDLKALQSSGYPYAYVHAPGPLPLLGVGAAFGYSRKLRKKIKNSKAPKIMSVIS